MRSKVQIPLWGFVVSLQFLLAGAVHSAESGIKLTPVESGFEFPVYVTNAADGTGRLFVVEQTGLVKVIQNGVLQAQPFLDIRDRVYAYWVWGLFGMAFHPSYARNHRFFVYYTRWTANRQMQMVLAEFASSVGDPNRADSQEKIILTIDYPPYAWHLGGHIAFGPDNHLYVSTGDGSGDGHWNAESAQKLDNFLGKVLRINVDSGFSTIDSNPSLLPFRGAFGSMGNWIPRRPVPEIWAYGFRNPWRFSFDTATTRLFLGDVGETSFEEVDLVARNGNYGWPRMEGKHCYPTTDSTCDKNGLILPIFEYNHPAGFSDVAVIGGYVYRGNRMPSLTGSYIFGDNGMGDIWELYKTSLGVWSRRLLVQTGLYLVSFGQDEQGELYTFDYLKGVLYRLDPVSISSGDLHPALQAECSQLPGRKNPMALEPCGSSRGRNVRPAPIVQW